MGTRKPYALPLAFKSSVNPRDEQVRFVYEFESIFLGQFFIAQNRLNEAEALFDQLLASARLIGAIRHIIEIQVLRAILFEKKGKSEKAMGLLKDAIELAAPEDFIFLFLHKDALLEKMLLKILDVTPHPHFVRKLLKALRTNPTPEAAFTNQNPVEEKSRLQLIPP